MGSKFTSYKHAELIHSKETYISVQKPERTISVPRVTAKMNSKFVPYVTRLISDQLKDRIQALMQENKVPVQHGLRYNKYYLIINIMQLSHSKYITFSSVTNQPILFVHTLMYCDMSTHCWVTQQSVAR
jgi:hypothetical protein